MNLGWVDVNRVAGHTKNSLFFQEVFEQISLFISPAYILSIVLRTCCGTAVVKINFGCRSWISASLSFQSVLSKTWNRELWRARFWIPVFSSPFPFKVCFATISKNKLWMVDLGFLLSLSLLHFKVSFPELCFFDASGNRLYCT